MAFSYDFCATRILNISRPSGWLDGQKHLRCRCSLPLLTLGTILASRPACVATTAHHPKMASAAALAGALNRIAVSAKPTAKKTNVVAKKVRLRRATHRPIRSRGIGFLPLRIRRVDVTFAGCVRGFDARVWGEVDARGLSPCV